MPKKQKNTRKNLPSDLLPSDLRGHTTYKAPTLATSHFHTTSVQTQLKRQSTVLRDYYIKNSKNFVKRKFCGGSKRLTRHFELSCNKRVAKYGFGVLGLIALSSG